MNKFWKVMKLIGLLTLISGGIALLVCYIFINEQTVMAIDKVVDYLDRPLFVYSGTTITLGLVVFLLLRYALKLNKDKIGSYLESAKSFANEKEEKAKEYYELTKQVQQDTKVILTNYDTKIEQIAQEIVLVCEKMPNAKINKLGKEFQAQYVSAKVELKEQLDNIDNYIEEKQEQIDYKVKYEELESKLNSIIERLENKYGESEERTIG